MTTPLPNYLNKKQLINRGWSIGSIKRFLGFPVARKEHPEQGHLVSFWRTSDVLQAESTKEWKEWRKRKELMDIVEGAQVTVNRMELDAVTFAAVNDYNHLHVGEQNFRFATVNSDPAFLNRVIVNYLRHQQTNYDDALKIIARKTGKEQAYALLKNKVLAAIARTYPSLHDECVKQRVSVQDVLNRIR